MPASAIEWGLAWSQRRASAAGFLGVEVVWPDGDRRGAGDCSGLSGLELDRGDFEGEHEGRWVSVRVLEGYGQELARIRLVRSDEADFRALTALEDVIEFLRRLLTFEFELDGLSAELADTYESVNMIYDLSEVSEKVSNSTEMCQQLLAALQRQIPVRAGCILLADDRRPGAGWAVQAHFGDLDSMATGEMIPLSGRLHDDVAEGAGLLCDQAGARGQDLGNALLSQAHDSLLAVPLRSGEGTAHGGVVLFDRHLRGVRTSFTAQDRKLVETVATQGTGMIRGMRMAEINKEMEIGRRIQRSLLPTSVPQTESVQVAGLCSMARVVGGDLYDAAVGSDGELRAVIADVSGHDLGSALLMAAARAHFRAELRGEASPCQVVERVNRLLHEDLRSSGLFLTFFVVAYKADEGCLRYSAGGHDPMILLPEGKDEVLMLDAPGMPAGLSDRAEFPECSVAFGPGDLLLMYTDGLTEATRPDGEMFGEERLSASLRRERHREPGEILARIEREIRSFTGTELLEDDGTALLLKGVGARRMQDAQVPSSVGSTEP